MIKIIKKVLSFIEWILVLALTGLVVYILISGRNGQAVDIMGYSVLHVITGSMEPTISVNEYIYIERVDKSTLKERDIVAYYSEAEDIKGCLVIHRIVKIEETEDGVIYTTQGDANPIPDKLGVRADQILGVYRGRVWFLNWLTSFADPQKLLLMLVVIPMFLISIYEAGSFMKLVKKAESEETLEERIERLKKEAVEEYIRNQTDEADNPAEKADTEMKENGEEG